MTSSTTTSPRGWRSDLDEIAAGKREWVPLLREFYEPFVGLVDQKRKELERRDFTTEATDEVCSEGPPDGHPPRPQPAGSWPARCIPSTSETRPLPGEEPEPPPSRASARRVPSAARATLVARARPLRPVRRLLALPRLQLHPQDRPAAARAAAPSRSTCPKCGEGHLTARRARRTGTRLLGLLALPEVRLHLVARAARRRARRRRRARWRARARQAHLPASAARRSTCRSSTCRVSACPAASRIPQALRRPAAGPASRRAAPRGRRRATAPLAPAAERAVTGAEALDAFLGRLAARDSSEHTRRAYRTAIGQYLDFLDEHGADWRDPGAAVVRGYLAELTERGLSRRSISSRLAALRSFYRHARREGLVERRSVVGRAHAAPAAPPAAGARRGGGGDADRRGRRHRAVRRPLVLRDTGARRDGLCRGPAHQRAGRRRASPISIWRAASCA